MSLTDRELWQETADALGMSLEDLLTAASYETGGTLNPVQRGPTTKWGQHKGLIQFGEPQAKQYGVDFSSPEAALRSQLGREGAIVKYMRAHGYDPEKHGFENFYATINAGNPNALGASDAHAGGAPGTVRDKVREQMGGHRANARKWLGQAGLPTTQADLSFGNLPKKKTRAGISGHQAGLNEKTEASKPEKPAAFASLKEKLEHDEWRGDAGGILQGLGSSILAGEYF